MTNTPLERIWDRHVIKDYGDGRALIHIDRHFAQEGTSGRAFDGLRQRGLPVRRRDLTLATIDHGISTKPGRTLETWAATRPRNLAMQRNCEEFSVTLFSIDHANHGIVHVVGPHLGFALPGCTYVCGDSHTASCGGVGAWAWGIGTSEVMQVFATQSLIMRKPRTLRAEFHGTPGKGIYAKDMILALIGRYGVDAGVGHVVQYRWTGDPRHAARRPPDDLQHVDRVRRARRLHRRRRHDVRVSARQADGAEGRTVGPGGHRVAHTVPMTRSPNTTG